MLFRSTKGMFSWVHKACRMISSDRQFRDNGASPSPLYFGATELALAGTVVGKRLGLV